MLHYPIPTQTRANLVKLYYELILIPGMDPRCIRSWVDTMVKLLANKGPGFKRKLQPSDLQLQWRPLWCVLQKELFPKKRGADHSCVFKYILLLLPFIYYLNILGAIWLTSCCMLRSSARLIIRAMR